MKYIITVLMAIPMCFSISFSNNLDSKSFISLSGSISANSTNALEDEGCSNGTINLEIDSPNEPYYIEWSNGATTESIENLSPGEYCVTVTDDLCGEAVGCWEIKCCPFILGEYQIQYNVINPACEGAQGALEVYLPNMDQDDFPLSFYLENSTDFTKYDMIITSQFSTLIKLTEGNYTGQLIYGECSSQIEFEIIFEAIEIEFTKTASCDNDGSIIVHASFGKKPYSYAWSDDETNTSSHRTGLSSKFYTVTVTDASLCSASASGYIKAGDPIITEEMSVFIGQSNCFNNTGVIEITSGPDGGFPPFSYEWSNGDEGSLIEGLEGGEYQVTIVDDQGCAASTAYIVPVTGQPIINSVYISNTCSGQNTGELGVIASSTTGGELEYAWSNGSSDFVLENLSKGSYTVTITDLSNGCPLVKTYKVKDISNDPLMISETIKNNCESEGDNNGKISLSVTGGIKPYSFQWNTGGTTASISNLSEGEYTVIVTDNCGNVEISSYNVTSTQIAINLDLSYPNFEEFILEANVSGGNAPYEYLWNTGSELSFLVEEEEGTYSVTVTDQNGCSKSESIDVICDPPNYTFFTNTICYSPFKLKIGANTGIGPGPFLLRIEKKINQEFELVEFRQFLTTLELLTYEFEDEDAGTFRIELTNFCGDVRTETFSSCVDCDYYFFEEDGDYFASAMGDLLFFEMVCPCSKDCGVFGLTTDKVKLIINEDAIQALNDEVTGFASFKINWPEGETNVFHSANQGKYVISGPSKYTLSNDEYDNGITVSVSLTLPFGLGEVCNLSIPFKFGQEGNNGYFAKWDNAGLNPFINHVPPYNWATIACPYKCKIPIIDGVLYDNEPIDTDDQKNYKDKCSDWNLDFNEYFLYEPNDYTKPCSGGGILLTHFESVIGVIAGQKTIQPNVAIDAHPYWPSQMMEEKDPMYPYSCPPHTYEKGYCLFDSRDVYGEDVILRDPLLASYCKDRFFDPPVDTDEDGIPDEVDPCPLNPDISCINDDGNVGDDTTGGGLGGGGGGGGIDENGCQTTFLPNECKLAKVCPGESVTYTYGVITTESYNGTTPCIHCFSADVCRVTDPETGEEYSSIVGPITGSVSFQLVDLPDCSYLCGVQFTCTATGEYITQYCTPDCTTYDWPICSSNSLYNIINLAIEEGDPGPFELEISPEDALKIINANRKKEKASNEELKLTTIPNPSTKDFLVQFDSKTDFVSDLKIINTQNQIVFTQEVTGKKGVNNIKIKNELAPGLYIISINIKNKIIATKHVIQN